jgi:hypothetical protein
MTLVRILRDYSYPDLIRQTPQNEGAWSGIRFITDTPGPCDYAIVLNGVNADCTVECPAANVWAIMQEPPTEFKRHAHKGIPAYSRIYTQDASLKGTRYIHSQPALPWHIDESYDKLLSKSVPEKRADLSWVTSNLANLRGHRARMEFLGKIKSKIKFDLFGRGFQVIQNKWDALAPYRYSLAVENFRNQYYWSEKISDCFLAWSMPIYCGCTRIKNYFPSESMICFDIEDPFAVEKIRESIANDLWRLNLDAIEYARNLVLNRYQLFPFLAEAIHCHQNSKGNYQHSPDRIVLKRYFYKSLKNRVLDKVKRLLT